MPSRKKAKGKARRAAREAKEAKAAKAEEEESLAVVSVASQRQVHEESLELEAQMQRLVVNATSPKLCRHGCPSLSPSDEKSCEDFFNAFISTFHAQRPMRICMILRWNRLHTSLLSTRKTK